MYESASESCCSLAFIDIAEQAIHGITLNYLESKNLIISWTISFQQSAHSKNQCSKALHMQAHNIINPIMAHRCNTASFCPLC
jgi:hypothetical protein